MGQTQAGKTFFFKRIREHQLIQQSPSRDIYIFGELARELTDPKYLYQIIECVQGLKNFLDILYSIEADERNLVVLEDQMS